MRAKGNTVTAISTNMERFDILSFIILYRYLFMPMEKIMALDPSNQEKLIYHIHSALRI